jgi:hypothetical protein
MKLVDVESDGFVLLPDTPTGSVKVVDVTVYLVAPTEL